MRTVERMLLNEYGVDKIVDARNIWLVYNHPTDRINQSFEYMEERFLFWDMGEVDYEDGFFPTMSLAQTKKLIEILQSYVNYYEYFKKEHGGKDE